MKAPRSIAVLAFDRVSPFLLANPCTVFGEALGAASGFELKVCALEPGPLSTTSGLSLTPAHGLEGAANADVIIVPGWRDPAEIPPAELLDALVAAHRRGAQVVGLCLGAYVLAYAGLLAKRRATTHWEALSDFARRFPGVALERDVLYVDEGELITSAGAAAGMDCCLYLLRRWRGAAVAQSAAKRLVVPPQRQGHQAQYVEQSLPESMAANRLVEQLDRVRATLDRAHSLDSLAQDLAMSRRTYTRRFRALTGTSPQAWLLGERLALAQRLLETSAHSLEQIAQSSGFTSAALLRHHFRFAFGAPPAQWRQRARAAQNPEPG